MKITYIAETLITNRSGGNGAIRDVCDLIYFSKILNEKT